MLRTSEQINEISKALSLAQSELDIATKDATNPHFKSKFADLAAIVKASRKQLSKNGIAVVQGAFKDNNDGWILTTRLVHTSGQWLESDFPLLARDKTSQAMGSATTYAKRYSLMAMTGVVSDDEDDDGEASMGRDRQKKPIPELGIRPFEPKKQEFKMTQEMFNKVKDLGGHLELNPEEFLIKLKQITGKDSSKDWVKSDYEKVIIKLTEELDQKILK